MPSVSSAQDEQKSPTLQRISDRLERLETLLSRLVDPRGSATSSAEHHVQHAPNFPSGQRETWELLLNDGNNVQYVNNSNLKDLLQTEERIKTQSVSNPATTPQQQRCVGEQASSSQDPCSIVSSNVFEFYPDSHLALQLWALYVMSVDPVLKILHIPTIQSAVIATILDPKSANLSMVALTFAIYFAAVTTLGHCDEPIDLPVERSILLKHYKAALDQLLLVTEVMNRPDITALQALAIYTTCLRVHEAGRGAWVLNGLTIRLAQSIGLHRDGASLHLSPFDSEIRLRLWWHLCVLDSRAPEDQGFELTIDVLNRGLRLPLNVDDNQLFPNMKQLPVESVGWTEMSFFLIQTESCRLLNPVLGTREHSTSTALPDLIAKRQIIEERTRYVSSKYAISATTDQLALIAMQHFTTARKKMEFMLQLREEIDSQNRDGTHDYPDVLRPSFKLACDGLESSIRLTKGGLSQGHKWLFTTYTPWYALAYVLRCLSNSPCGPSTDRAWALVEEAFPRELGFNKLSVREDGHGSIWKCLVLLRHQALAARNAQLFTDTVLRSTDSVTTQDKFRGLGEIEPQPGCEAVTSTLSDDGTALGQNLIPDSDQTFFSSLDFSISGVPYLPEWNAVIHGSLEDGNHSGMID
ncbi:hypothetical protein N7541_003046 [Penicillium brevicompactum]|uniref:Xylanolytic transcriptional activator regulatory domain-containing protein n=1 Tax=Penicillium brevicompactum TaxID=5074 RepID=A0A9W9UYK2_PENBR|nr:hypothetical protein N7541_003046 [Penicillium brevicompactum]